MLTGIIHKRLVLNSNTENSSMGTGVKTKYMCTNTVGSSDREVQACGSSLVIAFIFSVKQEAWEWWWVIGKEKKIRISWKLESGTKKTAFPLPSLVIEDVAKSSYVLGGEPDFNKSKKVKEIFIEVGRHEGISLMMDC